jgi:hypothetical protein
MWRRSSFRHLSERALKLKAAGCTPRQIRERLGVSDPYSLLRRERTEPSGTLRTLEAEAALDRRGDFPTIVCRADSAGFLRFYCRHCRTVHYHKGLVDGWHKARCLSGPYVKTGHKLEIEG